MKTISASLLKKCLNLDAKKLAKLSFEDLPSEDEWMAMANTPPPSNILYNKSSKTLLDQ